MNPSVIGKTYTAEPVEVSRAAAMFYALAVGDATPQYFDDRVEGGIIAPPTAAALWARSAVTSVLTDPAVGIRYDRLLHFSQTFHWLTPVHPGDRISTRAAIRDIREYENGGLLTLETESINQYEQLTARGEWVFMDRSAGRPGAGKPPRLPSPEGSVTSETRIYVPSAQTFFYAEASGDRNPLHLDDAHAVERGLPGIILHGLCTMALCHRALTEALCRGEPSRIRTLSVRFSRPVFPGSYLYFKTVPTPSADSSTRIGIIAEDRKGNVVLRDAFCTLFFPGPRLSNSHGPC